MTTVKKFSLTKGKKLAHKNIDLLKEQPEENISIPEWQKEEVHKRIREMQDNPGRAISWEDAQKKIKQLAK